MSDPVSRIAQLVIENREEQARLSPTCQLNININVTGPFDDKTIQSCAAKFLNLTEFPGFPRIPKRG